MTILSVSLFVVVLLISEHASLYQQFGSPAVQGGDWTSFTLNYNDSRYQADSAINSSNVASLKEAWFFPANYSVTSTPIVQKGHVYFADWGGNAYSLNISTGSDKGLGDWKVKLGLAISSTPAVSDGIVYFAGSPREPSRVIALNQTTGSIIWNTTLRTTPGGIYSSPIVYKGLVYVGISDCTEKITACSEHAKSLIGEMYALNALTGAPVWKFLTGNDSAKGGWGGGVWGSIVIDPTMNSIYFGTGNAYVSTSSICRTCSLYTYAIISLDATTGKLKWFHQVYKNLLAGGDNDFGSTPNLFSISIKGVTYQAVGLLNKNGNYYILERQNGKLLETLKLQNSPSENVGVGGFIYPSGSINPEIFIPAGKGYLEAFEPALSRSPLWIFPTFGVLDGSEVAVVSGAVLIGDGNGYLYAISIASHTALYEQKLPNIPTGYGIFGGVSVAEGFVLVGDYNAAAGQSSSQNSAGLYAFTVAS